MDRSILLVDGDVNFRRAMAIALRLEGVHVEEADGPVDARRRLASRPFDLALVDLFLPLGDAVELVELVRSRHPATRAILCCARPELFAAVRIRAPDVGRLEKPFSPESLLPLLEGRSKPDRRAERS